MELSRPKWISGDYRANSNKVRMESIMDIEINGSKVVRCSKCGSPMFSGKE